MKKFKVIALLSVFLMTLEFSQISFSQEQNQLIFPDVSEGNYHYTAIYHLVNLGIIQGYPDGTFKPKNNINRAEALKILTKAIEFNIYSEIESPLNSTTEINETINNCPFKDIQKDSWYYSYVCQAYSNQIVKGYPDGNFKPEQNVNRIEAIKMATLQSGINFQKPEFQLHSYFDTPETEWFFELARFAKTSTVFPEDRENNLYPGQDMNRGEFASLVYRFLKIKNGQTTFGRATYYGPGLEGAGTASGEPFDQNILAAAHKILPFHTWVKVTNLANSQSVIVYINDRGPYVHGAIIDLTTAAFDEIASLGAGVINTQVEILAPDSPEIPNQNNAN